MWIFYQFKFIRRDIGGKWGQVTGFLFGKRWIKLPETALLYDEFYDYSFGVKK